MSDSVQTVRLGRRTVHERADTEISISREACRQARASARPVRRVVVVDEANSRLGWTGEVTLIPLSKIPRHFINKRRQLRCVAT